MREVILSNHSKISSRLNSDLRGRVRHLIIVFSVQEALSNLEDYDKTCVESALQGVSNVVQQEWGSACPCQVLGVLYTTPSHLNSLLFRYKWCMNNIFFQWVQLPALIYCFRACLCTSFLCPVGGAGYRWISWYWQGFPASLPANTEASWGRQEVPTAFPFPYQNVHHVCSQRRGGNGLWFLLAVQQFISIYLHIDLHFGRKCDLKKKKKKDCH